MSMLNNARDFYAPNSTFNNVGGGIYHNQYNGAYSAYNGTFDRSTINQNIRGPTSNYHDHRATLHVGDQYNGQIRGSTVDGTGSQNTVNNHWREQRDEEKRARRVRLQERIQKLERDLATARRELAQLDMSSE